MGAPLRRYFLRSRLASERGFTLIELLVTISIVSILTTLGAAALRNYWFVRSLEGGKDQAITEMRAIQQRVISANNPVVYGARFMEGSPQWELIQYRRDEPDENCELERGAEFDTELNFDAGVEVVAADFDHYVDEFQGPSGTVTKDVTNDCLMDEDGNVAGTDIAWFFARGSATEGSMTIRQPALGEEETVCVNAITGRVYEREGASC